MIELTGASPTSREYPGVGETVRLVPAQSAAHLEG